MSISCLSILQRYKIQAIHNTVLRTFLRPSVVYQYFKDTKFKQFTTSDGSFWICEKLFINTSKIQNSSNSQHLIGCSFRKMGCLSILQRYKIQAIHNHCDINFQFNNVVYQYFKDTKFKQFTTIKQQQKIEIMLFINTSKIQNSSNSQLFFSSLIFSSCCLSILQRYKIQAIHN